MCLLHRSVGPVWLASLVLSTASADVARAQPARLVKDIRAGVSFGFAVYLASRSGDFTESEN
jgi:hypothetical protein